MISPNELLAKSLTVLATLQKAGKHVIRSADLPRNDRKRLQNAGFIQEVVRGWHLPSHPAEQSGSSSAWFAGMRGFVSGYCDERFGTEWHISPDQSLMLRTGERTLPRQLQVWVTDANNQHVQLPEGCSLFLYRALRLCESDASPDAGGSEPHPAARAVLGHFFFVYIHPYMDGNGRLGRFILNAMLVTGGYAWTVVPVEKRKPYMAALDQASSYRNVKPLAEFFADLVREQASAPLPRPRG